MENTIKLTANEIDALEVCLNYDTREGQLSDNYSNAGAAEIAAACGISKRAAGGVITSLQKKGLGMMDDEGDDIFWLSEKGVNTIFDYIEEARNTKPAADPRIEILRKVEVTTEEVSDWT